MIAIGIHMGGPEHKDSVIRNSLIEAMRSAEKNRDQNYDAGVEAWINPVFIVPGSIWKPDFVGCALGHFSKKKMGLVIQIVVPQSVANGEDVKQFIGGALREAARLASSHCELNGIKFSSVKAEKLISAIEADLPGGEAARH